MIKYITTILLTVLLVRVVCITLLEETFDRELQYCCPMSTDNVTLLIDEYFCVGVYNERRVLNIDCDDGVDIEIVEYGTFNVSHVNTKRFCFVTEEDEEVQLIAICVSKPSIQWILDLPYYCKCLSIIYLLLTLYGYARVETLRRPEDIPFIIFVGFLTISMISDETLFVFERLLDVEKVNKVVSYTQYYAHIGSFIWINIILLYQLRENM